MNWCNIVNKEECHTTDGTFNLRKDISDQLTLMRNLPVGPTYTGLSRLLAKLCLDDGDELEGIFHLIESHSVSLRLKIQLKYLKQLRKSQNCTLINNKFIEFENEYSSDYSCFQKRLEELPKEWTVVQLSCAHNSRFRFGGPEAQVNETPTLHVIRMECGQREFAPMCVTIPPPPQCQEGMYVPFRELQYIRSNNKTDKLLEYRKLYWETRFKVDTRLKALINFINSSWLQAWTCLLSGQLKDHNLDAVIRTHVNAILDDEAGVEASSAQLFPPRCRQILYCAMRNHHILCNEKLSKVVAASIGEGKLSPRTQRLVVALTDLSKDLRNVKMAKRHPVILIVDEKLDGIPWEMSNTLTEHPVTRIPSLHILHGLYKVHENTMVDGFKMVPSSNGFYIVNPNSNLPDMESRMKAFLLPRVSAWPGVIGEKPSEKEFEKALHDSDIFLYMGHGSGTQFFNIYSLQREIRSTAVLFGCSSAQLNLLGGHTESDGRTLIYPASASPCVIGMLWEVTDRDTDFMAQRILDAWLPKEDGTEENIIEPELHRALNFGRKGAKHIATSAAIIARGLPVKLQ